MILLLDRIKTHLNNFKISIFWFKILKLDQIIFEWPLNSVYINSITVNSQNLSCNHYQRTKFPLKRTFSQKTSYGKPQFHKFQTTKIHNERNEKIFWFLWFHKITILVDNLWLQIFHEEKNDNQNEKLFFLSAQLSNQMYNLLTKYCFNNMFIIFHNELKFMQKWKLQPDGEIHFNAINFYLNNINTCFCNEN